MPQPSWVPCCEEESTPTLVHNVCEFKFFYLATQKYCSIHIYYPR